MECDTTTKPLREDSRERMVEILDQIIAAVARTGREVDVSRSESGRSWSVDNVHIPIKLERMNAKATSFPNGRNVIVWGDYPVIHYPQPKTGHDVDKWVGRILAFVDRWKEAERREKETRQKLDSSSEAKARLVAEFPSWLAGEVPNGRIEAQAGYLAIRVTGLNETQVRRVFQALSGESV
jgi:hypothetical protein